MNSGRPAAASLKNLLKAVVRDSVLVFVVALVFRVYYLAHAAPQLLLQADSLEYFRIAVNVAAHGVYSTAPPGDTVPLPDNYRGPGYPTLIWLVYAVLRDLTSTYWTLLFVQALMGAATAAVAFRFSLRMLSRKSSLAVGGLVALSPHLVAQGDCILTETTFGFLIVAGALLGQRALENASLARWFGAGLAFAAAALVNAVILPFPLLLGAANCLRRNVGGGAVFLVAAMLPPLLWSVRDSRLPDAGIHSAGGRLFANVLTGLEPAFSYYSDAGDEAAAARARIQEGFEIYAHSRRAGYQHVLQRIGERPAFYATWYLEKPFRFWMWGVDLEKDGDIYIYPMRTSPFMTHPLYRIDASLFFALNAWLAAAALLCILLAAAPGSVGATNDACKAFALCAGLFWFATLTYAILLPDARYANPFRPFEFILAASCVEQILRHLRRLRERSAKERAAPPDASAATLSSDASSVNPP